MSRILESLKRKYGPLPLWAWSLIAGGALALWFRLRGGEPAPEAIAQPALAFGEPDPGDTGLGPVGEVGPVPGGAGEVPLEALGVSTAALEEQLARLEGVLERIPETEPGGVEIVEPDTGATETAVGVRWGGQTFTTKAGLGRWLASRYAGRGNAGLAYRQWAKRHPAAAALLTGPPPRIPPKKKPKAPTKASGRTGARKPAKPGKGQAGARARSTARRTGRVVARARRRIVAPGEGRPPAPPRRRRRRIPAGLRAFGRGGKRT